MTQPRIVAIDMDGTLIDPSGSIPDEFWPLLDRALAAGMIIAPASGRQLATLQHMFERNEPDTFIAENGAVVWHKGDIVSTKPMPDAVVQRVLEALPAAPFRATAVLCKPEISYTERGISPDIEAEVDKYYLANVHTDSLLDEAIAAPDDTVKIALFIESDAERDALPWLREIAPELNAVVSSQHWLDLMNPGAHKGAALEALASALGVDISQTAAIGDYLNDYEMLQAAGHAVAMGNAHPSLKEIADEIAPTNAEQGALRIIGSWL
ncbi:Putative phosphatase YwpJ [Corynebacterium capitovis DSM 44611]|uniref:Cof-type HAD-IIB family hydrolase n=1 Tax=Corynebacterium capitovis TaxID=131081 RepID=UPI0003751542|nr:HAD family hydrolase [Corynebacterium capitovis]WKD58003.1 Putative phosphatase YwpJ [Corynebacterium capitovis DSM 44611]